MPLQNYWDIKSKGIKMFALGGVVISIKEKASASLFHEILIALSGPAANFNDFRGILFI